MDVLTGFYDTENIMEQVMNIFTGLFDDL